MVVGQLPAFAPYPPASIRLEIAPEEWQECLKGWITLAGAYLQLPAENFNNARGKSALQLGTFLASYYHEIGSDLPREPTSLQLHRLCLQLLHKQVFAKSLPEYAWHLNFLTVLARCYTPSPGFADLLQSIWSKGSSSIIPELDKAQRLFIATLEHSNPDEAERELKVVLPLLQKLPDAAATFTTGSDFVDALGAAYPRCKSSMRDTLAVFTFLCLASLLDGKSANHSSLSDHLFSLKANAEVTSQKGERSLLSDIVTNTPLLRRIKESMAGSDAARARNLETLLKPFIDPSIRRPGRHTHRPVNKGKGRALEVVPLAGEVHIHRISLISQIQDLFPDLGAGFVMKLLDEYSDDVEVATAHLLDNSLPPNLRSLDRSEQIPATPATVAAESAHKLAALAPHSPPPPPPILTSLPRRRNVFDDDAFDRLAIDTSQLHVGKVGKQTHAAGGSSKAAILAALAAFDADDDERDDTYDADDVGALVSPTATDAEVDGGNAHDELLFAAWKDAPQLFARDAATRRAQPRQKLKADTGLTDEVLEGWAAMLARDPRAQRRLEIRSAMAVGGMHAPLERTSWRAEPGGGGEDSGGDANDGRGRVGGGGHGRGRGRGGRGRGGGGGGPSAVAGPAGDADTQRARQRKEAGKGGRANHNRRDQRAKKMARGGFPG